MNYNDMEIDDLDIMLALHTIKQVCVRTMCEECPFGDDTATKCHIKEKEPALWNLKEYKIWRAFK